MTARRLFFGGFGLIVALFLAVIVLLDTKGADTLSALLLTVAVFGFGWRALTYDWGA